MDRKSFYKVFAVLFVMVFYAGETRAEVLEGKEYQYDNVGNITGVIDRVNGGAEFSV